MNHVISSSDATASLGTKLEGLVQKLLALRAEIDSTLAEIDIDAILAHRHAAQSPALADRLANVGWVASQNSSTEWDASRQQARLIASANIEDDDSDLYVETPPRAEPINRTDGNEDKTTETHAEEVSVPHGIDIAVDAIEEPQPIVAWAPTELSDEDLASEGSFPNEASTHITGDATADQLANSTSPTAPQMRWPRPTLPLSTTRPRQSRGVRELPSSAGRCAHRQFARAAAQEDHPAHKLDP